MKRFIALALALVLCVSLMGVTALAADSAYLYMSGASAEAGGTVTLAVGLGNNPGIAGMQLKISYDDSLLEKVSYTGTGMGGGVWTIVNNAVWDNAVDSTYNGQILILTFKIKDSAKVGDTAAVSVSCSAGNTKGEYVSVGGASATVTVTCNHSWDKGVVTTPATCTKDGVMTYTCTKCGETKTGVIAAAHKWESVWTYDETYHWHKCSACGETCDKDKHALDVTAVQVPTPEKDGWKIYGCLTCDYSFSDKWEYGEEPKVGDIRPMMVLGASAALFTLAAAAYVFKRKTAV